MAYIVQCHNEHAPSDDTMYGPFTLEAARAKMASLVEESGDDLLKIRPEYSDLGYAGYEIGELNAADRDEDLVSEIWIDIHELLSD